MGKQSDELLNVILRLRADLAALDGLDLQEAAAHVDLALSLIEPFHPDVAAGLHGPRPLPLALGRYLRPGTSGPDPARD